ncbi:hypothetical protein TIFTF001_028003 [Ficus carica]|uniref:Uncharacterized protein n=1 Tax=Ficus carica TaxID=3494 RepID=A0AA88DP11_FICCA|nr:hypothetical protein TIFTF001_028003 [Ficus carica]
MPRKSGMVMVLAMTHDKKDAVAVKGIRRMAFRLMANISTLALSGDHDTKFFHASTIIRRRRKGIVLLGPKRLKIIFVEYFSSLFTSTHPDFGVEFREAIRSLFQSLITSKDNTRLCPDGIPGLFYKHYWDIVSHPLIRECVQSVSFAVLSVVSLMARSAQAVSHIFFADDIFLFCGSNREEVKNLKETLENFQRWSGLAINNAKSGFIFSGNMRLEGFGGRGDAAKTRCLSLKAWEVFNLALIAKLAWEFESCAEKLWIMVLRSKYGQRGLREPRMYLRSSALWVWRGLASSAEIIKKGACFIIKSGGSIKKVYRVMDDNSATQLVFQLFCSMTGGEDALRGILTPEGRFSVKGALNENWFSGLLKPLSTCFVECDFAALFGFGWDFLEIGDGFDPPDDFVAGDMAEFSHLLFSRPSNCSASLADNSKFSSWRQPPPGVIKFIDASFNESVASIRVVARDNNGEVVGMWCKPFALCAVVVGETKALLLAVQMAASCGFQRVIFEGDAKVVVDFLKGASSACWEAENLEGEVLRVARDCLSCSFVRTRRIGNVAAHNLSRWALTSIPMASDATLCCALASSPTKATAGNRVRKLVKTARKNFYVVYVGRRPGIYSSWSTCRAQVVHHPGNLYEGFMTLEETRVAYIRYLEDGILPQRVAGAFAIGCLIGALANIGPRDGQPG